jgi:hypothetical protein
MTVCMRKLHTDPNPTSSIYVCVRTYTNNHTQTHICTYMCGYAQPYICVTHVISGFELYICVQCVPNRFASVTSPSPRFTHVVHLSTYNTCMYTYIRMYALYVYLYVYTRGVSLDL